MTARPSSPSGRSTLRLLGFVAAVGGVVALGLLGWRWQAGRTVDRVTVTGTEHAAPDTLRRLARVDSGAVLGDVDASRVADRVERHPWVEDTEVTKRPLRRVLQVAVTERTPAALVVDAGRPAFYLDRHGFAMPLSDSIDGDVPRVRGLTADYHPLRLVAPSRLQAVLAALDGSAAASLVAELTVRPDSSVGLVTTSVGEHDPLPVRLGTGDPEKKLRQLQAFTEQVLVANPEMEIGEIDLRFDGRVIARKQPLDAP